MIGATVGLKSYLGVDESMEFGETNTLGVEDGLGYEGGGGVMATCVGYEGGARVEDGT